MSRHLFLHSSTLDSLSTEDRAIIGDIQLNVESGKEVTFSNRWQEIDNPTDNDDVCYLCLGKGYECFSRCDELDNIVTIESPQECQACLASEKAKELLPEKYKWVDSRYIKPFSGIPVPIKSQQELIDQIRDGHLTGHSVMYSGPSRTGKSVLSCALISHMVADYVVRGFFEAYEQGWDHTAWDLPIYRLNVDTWLAQHAAWDLHDWESGDRPERPEVNIESIKKLHKGPYDTRPGDPNFPPILVLEEIDKFKPTEYRLNALFSITNAVFESGGMIVSTSNLPEKEIRARFPDWFYRRLVESSKDEKIRHRDLWKVTTRERKTAKASKKLEPVYA